MIYIEGAFYKYGNLLGDILIVSLLWLLTSLPIFTIGASNTALFYVMTKRIQDKEGYIVKEYFNSFKSNFKTATILWFIYILCILLLLLNINVIKSLNTSVFKTIIFTIQSALLLECFIIGLYVFPILSRFHLKTLQCIKTAFGLANKHFISTLILVLLLVFIIFVANYIPIFAFFVVGFYTYSSSCVFVNIFKSYTDKV